VVALAKADEFVTVRLALELPVLTRHFQSTFHRIGTAIGEHHGGHAFGLHHLHQPLGQLNRPHMGGATKDVKEGQLVHLRHDGVNHRPIAVAQIARPQATHTVEHFVPIHIPDPAAFAFGNDVGGCFFHRPGMRHGVPQVLRIVGFELIVVHVWLSKFKAGSRQFSGPGICRGRAWTCRARCPIAERRPKAR